MKIEVSLGSRSYPIHIGPGYLADKALVADLANGKRVGIVTNKTVAPFYLEQVKRLFPDSIVILLPDGEQYKTLDGIGTIITAILEARLNRSSLLVALGGGVIGDMTGFAAACYQRGIDFIQIPTTLLAQVDSSVGGKTGVNHPLGKNMIGAFHQPRLVIIDTDTLSTLPDREFSAGMAEVIKYGLIADPVFFVWLEKNMDRLLSREPAALAYAIQRSCEIKAWVVSQDEREEGIRATLNLGHTFGHAIETSHGYGSWLHGEAVAVGMVMAVDLSMRLGWITADMPERVQALLASAHLPVTAPATMTLEQFLDVMIRDKKNVAGKIRLVLLKALGEAVVTEQVASELLQAAISNHIAPSPPPG